MYMSANVGDIVRFKPKYYGPQTPDQWKDVTGIILEIIEASGSRAGATVLALHPDEPVPIPVFAFFDDFEKIEQSENED
jgi:hypothetical protein|tara:strand:- start:9286 stop:9522 length:237 start_codon:yes stop_codon:yes gene_type:complete